MPANSEQLNLYKPLFKGRTDVFATRWEKGNKSAYIPAYTYDPYQYKWHQMQGGTFQTFQDKTYQALTDHQIIRHFEGQQVTYPKLLPKLKFSA